jgi:uncharacterized OB-fold protein
MLSQGFPAPISTPVDADFWMACRQHELRLRHCLACHEWHHPPLPLCPNCQGSELQWRRVEGPALLYSWTGVHIAMHPSVAGCLPYYIAVIEFPACSAVRFIAQLDSSATPPRAIGALCELCWLTSEDGQPVPAFRIFG